MLEARGLTRTFGDLTAVDEASFVVRPGRLTGFVGANGAGKTTTMRMLMGVLGPSAGEVWWEGRPATDADRRGFGYMPEERGLYPRMRIVDQLSFFARLHGWAAPAAARRARELLGFFDLQDRAEDALETLSLGNQQRVQIAAALVHRPTALVLDEPFSGLDPLAVDAMADLLHTEAADLPVLFSSHQLDLVERLCDDLVILAGGKVVAAGSVAELRDRGPRQYAVHLDGTHAACLHGLRGVVVEHVDGPRARIRLDGLEPAALVAAVLERSPVLEVAQVHPPLAEVFREVTR